MKTIPFSIVALVAALLLSSCEHSGYTVNKFSGDYRFYAGIAEFFNCSDAKKYYVADSGIYNELQSKYQSLELKEKEDIFIELEGYLKRAKPKIEGIEPGLVFVPVKIISLDTNRGCNREIQQGD